MAETYHGVPIPDDFWTLWSNAFEEGAHGFRIGVRSALHIEPDSDKDRQERYRLDQAWAVQDAAEEAAWQAQHDREMAEHRARQEKTDGTS